MGKVVTLSWLIVAAIVVIGVFVAWQFTMDDAYITFRYSKHLADGTGLVWNPDSTDPVEGYTNFLWMVLMALPHLAGWSPILFSKLTGLAAYVVCGAILYMYAYRKSRNPLIGFLAVIPLIILPSAYFHALSGLETMTYGLILLLLFIIGHNSAAGAGMGSRILIISAALLTLLAGLTRPEGVFPGLVVFVTLLLTVRAVSRRTIFVSYATLFFAPGALYFVWRFSYFGWLLPNTFYVKFGNIFDGIEWLAGTVGSLAAALLIMYFPVSFSASSNRNRAGTKLYTAVFLIMAAMPYFLSSLTTNYMNRFLFHLLPVIFLSLALAYNSILRYLRQTNSARPRTFLMFTVLSLFLCLLPLLHQSKREIARLTLYGSHLENSHIALGKALNASDMPNELRTLAVGDAGAIPYYSEWHVYDFVGLTEETVAHHPESKSDYIARMQPTLMIAYSADGKTLLHGRFGFWPDRLLPEYREVAFIKMFPNYFLGVFIRNDIDPSFSKFIDPLVAEIERISVIANSRNDAIPNRVSMLINLRNRLNLF